MLCVKVDRAFVLSSLALEGRGFSVSARVARVEGRGAYGRKGWSGLDDIPDALAELPEVVVVAGAAGRFCRRPAEALVFASGPAGVVDKPLLSPLPVAPR